MHVHFICRGNVFRSLIAETYLKSLRLPGVTVVSSGTKADYYRESNKLFFKKHIKLLGTHGLGEYIKKRPEQLTQSRIENSDLVIIVNDIAYQEAVKIVKLPSNTVVWDITDIGEGTRTEPYENGRKVEEVVYDEITSKVDELVAALR
jgi:protein-tyrosine-phosphatase